MTDNVEDDVINILPDNLIPAHCLYVQVNYVVKKSAAGAVCYDQSSRDRETYSLTTLTEVSKQHSYTIHLLQIHFAAVKYVKKWTPSLQWLR